MSSSMDVFSRCRRRSVSSLVQLCMRAVLRSRPTRVAAAMPAHTKDTLMRNSLALPDKECRRWLSLLVTRSTQHLRLSLRRYNKLALLKLIRMITRNLRPSLMSPKNNNFAMLTRLVLRDCSLGPADLHVLRRHVEQLTELLSHVAPRLLELVLPLISNEALRHVAKLEKLVWFSAQQPLMFDRKGLMALCESSDKSALQQVNIGVGRRGRAMISAEDVGHFLSRMPSLRRLCVCDQTSSSASRRAMTYEALNLLASNNFSDSVGQKHEDLGTAFSCDLRELRILDSVFSPALLLASCPRLSKLIVDFKESHEQVPGDTNWFQNLIREDDWGRLCHTLRELKIVFPALYNRQHYSLFESDFQPFINSLGNISRLVLIGVGWSTPLPLPLLLDVCPCLNDLCLLRSCVAVNCVNSNGQSFSHPKLKKFVLVGQHIGESNVTQSIVNLMPRLHYLELSPTWTPGTEGLVLSNLSDLTELPELYHLTISLSLQCCLMNMPSLLLVLRDFQALGKLCINWERKEESNRRVKYMVDWMAMVLKGANVELDVELKAA